MSKTNLTMSYKEELQKLWAELQAVNKNVLSLASQANVNTLEEHMIKAEEMLKQLGMVNNDLCGKVSYLKRKEGEFVKEILFKKLNGEKNKNATGGFMRRWQK